MEIGRRLLAGARGHRKGLFSAGFWSDRLVAWTMKDPSFRTQLFRFIDVFPCFARRSRSTIASAIISASRA